MLSPQETRAIKANLFKAAHGIFEREPSFRWHKDRTGRITADRPRSSQALAVDLFETTRSLSASQVVLDAWMEHLGIPSTGSWNITLESEMPRTLLGEPRPTQVDAVLQSDKTLVLFECKFTEAGGGRCSQTDPIREGAHAGAIQCNGRYELQTNPVNQIESRCTLTGKGVRYWEFVQPTLGFNSAIDHAPCPFVGGNYQLMRNTVAAYALGRAQNRWPAFVLLYADGDLPVAKGVKGREWLDFCQQSQQSAVTVRAVSYQTLLDVAAVAARDEDQRIISELKAWVNKKIDGQSGQHAAS